ncbi:metallophosphoesterase family protein [Paenibacillus humicola]|uniref:metallophosphoesterase family protein n=1 Tax=Paenibacillus humicola TaxID=3110540 RepID=UPI00237B6686|nr:metallophosphoesterase [Paenibacillus humicola]
MRIVILGDFHLNPEQYEATQAAMEDIRRCRADLVIPLGDFGSRMKIGTVEGLEEAQRFLRMPGVPLRPILGNHDLERESGAGEQRKGTMQERFVRMFGLDKPYGVMEFDRFRFFFASTEPQDENSCYDVQEVFATDEQFDWLKSKLKERPNIPVIFFTHAPPVGAGLRTVPRVHVRSTNAYLDENHDPYRWYRLFKHTPEIVMWFSAHYHLSHVHPDSHTYRFGTHFFITGVHGASFTRDGNRQSRILELEENSVKVLTLDHSERSVTEEGGWTFGGPLKRLVNPTVLSPKCVHAVSVGESPAARGGLVPLSPDRCLVSTQDGFTWEVEPRVEAVFGTLHIGPALTGAAVSGDCVWMAWGSEVGLSDRRSPWRFVRDANGPWPLVKERLKNGATAIAARPDGGIWAAAGLELLSMSGSPDRAALAAEPYAPLPEPSRSLIADGSSLWTLSESGTVYRYDERGGFEPVRNALAWDTWKGYSAALHPENGRLLLSSEDGHHTFTVTLPVPVTEAKEVQVVCLGGHRVLAAAAGEAFVSVVSEQTVVRLETGGGFVTALSRSYPNGGEEICESFYIGLSPANERSRPQLQLWSL